MKNAYWGYWLILLGVFVVVIMLLVRSVTSNSTQDYYLIKELTKDAMVDAIDFAYYRDYKEVKINKEKFYEAFLRRFEKTASVTENYKITFTDVYEAPPKVSVEVRSTTGNYNIMGDATNYDIVNRSDMIIEVTAAK